MIDISLIRDHPDVVRKDLKKRGLDFPFDELVASDRKWRETKLDAEKLKKERNETTIRIAEGKKAGKDTSEMQRKVKAVNDGIKKADEGMLAYEAKRKNLWMRLPNILHESVPVGKDDKANVQVKTWGNPLKEGKDHLELLTGLGLIDVERGAKLAGSRFYYLKGPLVRLDYALQMFALDSLTKRGFTAIEPPYMMNRKAYEGVTDLGDFETVMYKIDKEDLYMIATSEHPMAAMYMDEVIDPSQLPMRFAGISPCFRREVGAHGKYSKGLFRMHQFNKVEMFVFAHPNDSWKIHEEMQRSAEELYEALEIPYRAVNVCTGDIGTVAAKKYDIEAWFPSAGEYKEVGSNSNCTDYQARRLNVRYGKEGGDKEYLHTLNSTALATSRTMVALIENNQNKDGTISVPKALQPYTGFRKMEKA